MALDTLPTSYRSPASLSNSIGAFHVRKHSAKAFVKISQRHLEILADLNGRLDLVLVLMRRSQNKRCMELAKYIDAINQELGQLYRELSAKEGQEIKRRPELERLKRNARGSR